MGNAVCLIAHAAQNSAGYAKLIADAGHGSALHLTGQCVELGLKLLDIGLAGDKLVAGGDHALMDLGRAQHIAGSVVSDLGKGAIHGDHAGLLIAAGFAVPNEAVVGLSAVVMLHKAGADDHVHHVHVIAHAAGNAGKDNALDREVIQQGRGIVGREDLADAGLNQYHVLAIELTHIVGLASDHGFLLDVGGIHKSLQFHAHGADDGGTRRGVLCCDILGSGKRDPILSNGVQHFLHHRGGGIGSLSVVEGIGIMGNAVGLVAHAAQNGAGHMELVRHAGHGSALHLAGQCVELGLKFLDIGLAGNELVAGGDHALMDLLRAQHGAGRIISDLGKALVHRDHAGLLIAAGLAVPLKTAVGLGAVVMLHQLCGNDHVHHIHVIAHAAGNAGKDDAAHVVGINEGLSAGRRQHLADTGLDQHHIHAVEDALIKGVACDLFRLGDLGRLHQCVQFHAHSADDTQRALSLRGPCLIRSCGGNPQRYRHDNDEHQGQGLFEESVHTSLYLRFKSNTFIILSVPFRSNPKQTESVPLFFDLFVVFHMDHPAL